jgi:two-component system OmpR family response regulator
MRVLIADDEPGVLKAIRTGLERAGDVVDTCGTGTDALWFATEGNYDVILLDVNLPPPDGFEVCRSLRERGVWTPVLLLTGRAATRDRVFGLDVGADDYLLKPFSLDELQARMRALVRRGSAPRPTVMVADDLELDPAARRAQRQGTPLALTHREYDLLELLVRSRGAVMTREEISTKLWDFAFESNSNVVDVTIRRLRQKVDAPFGRNSIRTVRGVGYLFSTGEQGQAQDRPRD